MDRVTQRLWRGVEGPRCCLLYPCCSELSTTEAGQKDLLRYALAGNANLKRDCMAAENLDVEAGHSKTLASYWFSAPRKNRAGPGG
jgi:hypothetical protein